MTGVADRPCPYGTLPCQYGAGCWCVEDLAPVALPTADPCPGCGRTDCTALNHR